MLNRLKEQFLPTRVSPKTPRGQRPYHSTQPHAAAFVHSHSLRASSSMATAPVFSSMMHQTPEDHSTTCTELLQRRETARRTDPSHATKPTTTATVAAGNDDRCTNEHDTQLAHTRTPSGTSLGTMNSSKNARKLRHGVEIVAHALRKEAAAAHSSCRRSTLAAHHAQSDTQHIGQDSMNRGSSGSHGGEDTAEQARFRNLLSTDPVDLAALRAQCWNGCPEQDRFIAWMYLTGCWHPHASKRAALLQRRRAEYRAYRERYYHLVDWDAVCRVASSGRDETLHRSTMPGRDAGATTARHRRQAEPTWAKQRSMSTSVHSSNPNRSNDGIDVHSNSNETSCAELNDTDGRVCIAARTCRARAMRGQEQRSRCDVIADELIVPPCLGSALLSPSTAPTTSELVTVNTHVGRSKECDGKEEDGMHASRSCAHNLPSACPPRQFAMSVGAMLSSQELLILRQIRKDVPRSAGGLPALAHPRVQSGLERILFIWSMRHPACGYVQGMNDVVMLFMRVALAYYYCPSRTNTELETFSMRDTQELWDDDNSDDGSRRNSNSSDSSSGGYDRSHEIRSSLDNAASDVGSSSSSNKEGSDASTGVLNDAVQYRISTKRELSVSQTFADTVEADVYWTASYVLGAMQDNYTYCQDGVMAMMSKMAAVLRLADGALYEHLVVDLGIDMPQFAYRWMNCLLLRELTLSQAFRLFDAYLADETKSWTSFHVYVCVALLLHWSTPLYKEQDYGRAVTFLQNLPAESMAAREMDELMSEAFLLQNLYEPCLPRR